MNNTSNIQTEITAIGTLIGLLSPGTSSANNSYNVNTDWFKNPLSPSNGVGLESIGNRLQQVIILIDAILGPAAPNMPAVFENSNWYSLPDPDTKIPFYIVTSPPSENAGQLGFGFSYTLAIDDTTINLYAYIPCLSYSSTPPNAGTQLILGSKKDNPCQVGFRLSSTTGFKNQEVTFSGISIVSSIYISDTAPTISVTFIDLQGASSGEQNPFNSFAQLTSSNVLAWFGEILLDTVAKKWLDIDIGNFSVTAGQILKNAGFLSIENNAYQIAYNSLSGSATDIAINFVYNLLQAFPYGDKPIITLPGGGLYVCSAPPGTNPTRYGFRLVLELNLTNNIVFCLGIPLTGATTTTSSWLLGNDPGISVYLVSHTTNGTSTTNFDPACTIAGVGVNLTGSTGTPLIDENGYTLGKAEVRGSINFSDLNYGVACRLDDLGIPLGPGFGETVSDTNTNPVAKNLVSSGKSDDTGEQDAVNPAFSLSAAYVKDGTVAVQLYDKDGKPSDTVMLPVNRALGPLQCERIGIGWQQDSKMLSIIFDGGVKLASLDISLNDLSIGIPVTSPADFSSYVLNLNGMGLSFSAGAVELSGAFVKLPQDATATPPRRYIEYNGDVLIKAGVYSISAVGSYAYVTDSGSTTGYASMFIFGMLKGEIGGPAFFFVTGIAAGFGYNRQLILPDMDGVADFPFLKMLNDDKPDPLTVLSDMAADVPPQRGEYWLAAGVQFTSFDLIHSTALVTVEFGHELEIALLGTAWLSLPPLPAPVQYLYAELGIEIKVLPDEAFLGATAILTPNSYVIDPACKLTGGFAFYAWFGSNPHAGEFVLTIGGYHPSFTPPDYYPTVPRLAFNWPVSGNLTIDGEAYFALTPSAVMAGAALHILYNSANLNAWFNAQMDALIIWAPFHYNIDISINVGASYKINWLFTTSTVSIELGADVTIWGPKMGGTAHVNWSIISFTINFGAGKPAMPATIGWTTNDNTGFAQTLLPHKSSSDDQQSTGAKAGMNTAAAQDNPGTVEPGGIYTINVTNGLLNTFKDSSNKDVWLIRPNHFSFSALTVIPAMEIDFAESAESTIIKPADGGTGAPNYTKVNIRPMNTSLTGSTFTITVTQNDNNGVYDYTVSLGKVPAAKWGAPIIPAGSNPEMNAMLDGQLLGLENITPKQTDPQPSGSSQLLIDIVKAFVDSDIVKDAKLTGNVLPFSHSLPVSAMPVPDDNAIKDIQSTLMDSNATAQRIAIFHSLQNVFNIDVGTNGDLSQFAKDPGAILTGNPMMLTIT